ncbi:MAG TPA: phosphopantetheine-binding protein [Kofleriaceae bacterium]|nr:phosphopantetheine-binding protein [Kofleriaceae bacterium]
MLLDRFYERLAEVLEEDKVGPDDVLASFEQWDSLTALSVVAMIDESYAVNVSAEELAATRTAAALEALVVAKRKP